MEIKGLKENEQVKDKMKRQIWRSKTSPNSPKQDNPRGTHLGFFQGSLKRVHSSEVGLFLVKLT